MKITQEVKQFKSNVDESNSLEFGISDVGFVIEILRSKLYEKKVQTPVQEYISNARDANREVGASKKIHITFPTREKLEFKVRDYGLGITPERMSSVFVMYGSSTKRSTNGQVGGYGVGAKSAWAYTDSFTITTFVDGVKRIYVAHTGANASGRLDLISETETNEENGTEISYNVRTHDIQEFANAIIRTTMFWSESEFPEFSGESAHLEEIGKKREAGTARFMNTNMSAVDADLETNINIVIDGIPYGFPQSIALAEKDKLVKISGAYNLNLFIPNGLVSIAANREKIDTSDMSKNALKQVFVNAIAEWERAHKEWEDQIVNVHSLIAASTNSCGFKLRTEKTFDYVSMDESGGKCFFHGNRNVIIDNENYTERLFRTQIVGPNKNSHQGLQMGIDGENRYYVSRPGAVRLDEIRSHINNTSGLDYINLVIIQGQREEEIEIGKDLQGKPIYRTKVKRVKEIGDELIPIVEKLGFVNIEDVIPRIPAKERAKRKTGAVISIDLESEVEVPLTLAELEEEEESGPWLYYVGTKSDHGYDSFKSAASIFENNGEIERAFRVIESNAKHVIDDDRFIKYEDFIKDWKPNDKVIFHLARRDTEKRERALDNIVLNFKDKNHVIYKVAQKLRSSTSVYSNYEMDQRIRKEPKYQEAKDGIKKINNIIDKHMTLICYNGHNGVEHVDEYIKWGLDNAAKNGVVLSVPEILVK